eukprot:TRINITY_DN11839_c0_g1_i1.p1 TRINITY_DN11839_c0_g1~~TRINITY_DN11839_c0_g1_i1.p1  ORF type:complete len:818 (+),score=182.45 TRINITY_DN11839_c0_g1_i1:970-3423(+)
MNLFVESIGNPTKLPIPSTTTAEVLGPIKQSLKIDLDPSLKLNSSVLVLYKRFKEGIVLHSLKLFPEYEPQASNEERKDKKITGIHCFLSSEREGYLYDVYGKAQAIATFSYITSTTKVCIDELFLYTLNDDGLGIAPMRTTFSSHFQHYSPMWVGQVPTSGLVQLCSGNGHLVLLSKTTEEELMRRLSAQMGSMDSFRSRKKRDEESTVGWKVVVYQPVSSIDLYKEILQQAMEFAEYDPSMYIQLLLEGHCLLLDRLSAHDKSNYYLSKNSSIKYKINYEVMIQEIETAKKCVKGSYSLIADYLYKVDKNYKLAALCYALSETRIAEAILNLKGENEIITSYLDAVLFNHEMRELLDTDANLQNSIIEHYAKYSPKRLGKLILESYLTDFNLDLAIEFLEDVKGTLIGDSLNEGYLASTLLHLEKESWKAALVDLTKLPESQVVYHCVNNPKLLSPETPPRDVNILSLGMALRDRAPWALIEVLVKLKNNIKYSDAKNIIYSAKNKDNSNVKALNKLLLLCYTEAVVLETLNEQGKDKLKGKETEVEKEKQKSFENIIINLSQLYLDMISLPEAELTGFFQDFQVNLDHPKGRLNKDSGNFFEYVWKQFHIETFIDKRLHFYDKLPPFDPKTPFSRARKNSITSIQTHFYLRKLQGLLCIKEIRSFNRVLEYIKSKVPQKPAPYFFSFQLLCLNENEMLGYGLEILFNNSPELIVDFTKEYCKTAINWNIVLGTVLTQTIISDGEKKKNLYTAYEELLRHLSFVLDPDEFLKILPDAGNISFFLPFIENCLHHYNSKKLTQEIKADSEKEQTDSI